MGKTKVIVVFDIGKTNKKVLLFNQQLKIVYQEESKFETKFDEDGFECDDIELIESWIKSKLKIIIKYDDFDIVAVNFSTYGASLVLLDKKGRRLTLLYNYLKQIPENVQLSLFDNYGGETEFCRKTASPALGLLLNSGIQILWLKRERPELFKRTMSFLHFPQYLSYLFTNQIVSESTSIGCHTFLWDFDNNCYHKWLLDEGIVLPNPVSNSVGFNTMFAKKIIFFGIGIHDSSASLVPYLKESKQKFILVSTGTWCVNMNPFNHKPLTEYQLKKDCLLYLSADQNPVKSSRLFMGKIHDINLERICAHFNVELDGYKEIKIDESLLRKYLSKGENNRIFFKDGVKQEYCDNEVNLSQFSDFSEAYHRLIFDLTILHKESLMLIEDSSDNIECIYVTGGFARNEIFVRLLANFYSDKQIFTSDIDNSSALGAALVIWNSFSNNKPVINLGLRKWNSF